MAHKSPKQFDKAMGAVIRKLRQSHGMSMKTLAEQLGVSGNQVHKYEVGQNALSAELVCRLAAILGVTVAALYRQAGVESFTFEPSEAESAGILAARYVSRIKDDVLRSSVVDFARKLAYQGARV